MASHRRQQLIGMFLNLLTGTKLHHIPQHIEDQFTDIGIGKRDW